MLQRTVHRNHIEPDVMNEDVWFIVKGPAKVNPDKEMRNRLRCRREGPDSQADEVPESWWPVMKNQKKGQ